MEPVKFEKHIKDQLQKREIKPSAESWQKLQGRLEQKEAPSKKPFLWMGIAAAFAGIFFLLGTFFSNPFIENGPAVVEQTSEVPVTPETENLEPVPAAEEEILVASEEIRKQEIEQPTKISEDVRRKDIASAVVAEETPIAETASEEPAKFDLASVKERLSEESPEALANVSDAEIEALLLLAEAELEEEPAQYVSQTINPDDLLNEVEYELEQSFRDKVFEVIKDGLSKAKTAVANRDF